MEKIPHDYKNIHIRKWDKPLEKSYCIPKSGVFKFIANVTWGAVDFAAGGNSEEEAKNNLVEFINNPL